MKSNRIIATLMCLTVLLFSYSCREKVEIDENINIPSLGGTDEVPNEIDKWIYTNFTKPYNIEVVYRWDASQMQSSPKNQLVPIRADLIMPLLNMIKDVWFEPYIKACNGDSTFLKTVTPKKVVLVGSPEYQDGAIKLGQAEGGRKILLLNANYYDPSDETALKQYLHTIEHEFVHIMHQTKMFTKEFEDISAGFYSPTNWKGYTNIQAYQSGFTRNYGMSGKDEDFTEVMSMIMVYGKPWFENTVIAEAKKSTITAAEAALRKKESIVVNYLKDSWGIRFYDDPITKEKGLVTYVQEAIAEAKLAAE